MECFRRLGESFKYLHIILLLQLKSVLSLLPFVSKEQHLLSMDLKSIPGI